MPRLFVVPSHCAVAEPQGRDLLDVAVSWPSPQVTVLTVRGEVDGATANVLRLRLLEIFASRARLVVVDLSGVGFFGIAGLAVMLEAARRARGRLPLAWVTGPGCVDRLLEVSGHGDEVVTAVTVAAAVRRDIPAAIAEPAQGVG
ncbi:STAS domain-containing protein [Nocardia arthritidis]|uniref:STAS domain-containing protein n=1 Tax=Nocardia arthritidis TaxID=228602 RepID=A0A6G9YA20_9NOCA|nr:STAS domain-containing protein [Nocardia arthritidis]QIS10115.1 STAS domain-containing protein [Nocardia arthritidis]